MEGIQFESGHGYHYEHGDLVGLLTFINAMAVIFTNVGAYIGLFIAIGGLIYDLRHGCHWNNMVIRISLIALNIYFLTL